MTTLKLTLKQSRQFRLISCPTKLAILNAVGVAGLRVKGATVSQIVTHTGLTQPYVTRTLQSFASAGLVRQTQRGLKVYNQLTRQGRALQGALRRFQVLCD